MNEATPVVDAPKKDEVVTPSPAQDLRDIQALLIHGIYPGNMAPAVTKAYTLLDKMAAQVEADAKAK